MRLNAYIAKSGVCARRKAVELIKEGKVKVGGETIREPWYIVSEKDIISVGSRRLSAEKCVYLVLNKPKGVTSTREDKFARKKVIDMVPKRYGRLYPVGRLDKESRGLIILTNDGELCHRLTHPKFEVEKEYRVLVKGDLDDGKIAAIGKGVFDADEILKAKSCKMAGKKGETTELAIVIAEGKKRHIRRMLKCLGLSVLDLKRVRFGGLILKGIAEGEFLQLDKKDMYGLTMGRA